MLLDVEKSCLVVIDIQDKLNVAMFDPARAVDGAAKLLKGAEIASVPALVSEQYAKGLGPTVEALQPLMPEAGPIDKICFSCVENDTFVERFLETGRQQAVVCGIEAHVCVMQTVVELLEKGVEVFVVADATASRTQENHRIAMERIRDEGGWVVSVEMVLFEWLRYAGTPAFKEISQLVK